MYLEKTNVIKTNLVKILALGDHGTKIERVFEKYNEAKEYGLLLESQGYIVMFETLVHSSYEDLVSEYMNKIEALEMVYSTQSTMYH